MGELLMKVDLMCWWNISLKEVSFLVASTIAENLYIAPTILEDIFVDDGSDETGNIWSAVTGFQLRDYA